MVDDYVNSAVVSSFPPEEFCNVNYLQGDVDPQVSRDLAILLLLIEQARDNDQWPHCHAHSTVGPDFNINSQDLWVKVGSPEIVRKDLT